MIKSEFKDSVANIADHPSYQGTKFGGDPPGGGVGGPMEPMVTMREYVDKADEAVEARLNAKLDTVLSRLDDIKSSLPSATILDNNRKSVINNIWGTGVALLAALLGILAFAGDRFDGGMSVSPALSEIARKQAAVDRKQDAVAGLADDKLDVIINQTAQQ